MQFLGEHDNNYGTRGRTAQPQIQPGGGDDDSASSPGSNDETAKQKGGTAASKGTYEQIDTPFSGDPKEGVGRGFLSTAIMAKLTGNDVGDAVKNYAITVVGDKIEDRIKNAPERPDESGSDG